jgi:hypothetical protein
MCREANLRHPEITILCQEIVRSQREEINQMERILSRYQATKQGAEKKSDKRPASVCGTALNRLPS